MTHYGKRFFSFLNTNKAGIFFCVVFVIVLVGINIAGNALYNNFFIPNYFDHPVSDNSFSGSDLSSSDCNVTGINIHGDIVTYNPRDAFNDQGNLTLDQTSADYVTEAVADAQTKDNIKAIVVEVDSGGGSGMAGEEMMRAFKDSKKPVIAFIREGGMSAAYLAATGAQTIFASKLSDVGSIGVTMSYLQEAGKNQKEGLSYVDLSSGKFKDSGNPARLLTKDEKQLFMRDINISYEYFVSLVSQNRNLSIEKVKALADGSSVMGEQALKDGLVDKIGLLPDVENYISEKIGEKTKICW
ncbi:MAG: signal peptide peptidase SppA [Candidatus Paceibacterota bacterium]